MNDTLQEINWKHLPLRDAYPFGIQHGLEREVVAIKEMEIDWSRPFSVRRGLIVDLFDRHGILQQFKDSHWPNGNTHDGAQRMRS